ncbi:MAG: hypothetical protein CM15mP36_12340 [Flavobacteriales bacterium]|nr:MAG: hypothetical protein CM15mP36_12340 [Flavobacteriales bacterium]
MTSKLFYCFARHLIHHNSEIAKKAGYKNVNYVKSQMIADGNFSTVKSPNPEEIESLDLALKLGNKEKADIVIGTDPDADRLGIAIRDLKII